MTTDVGQVRNVQLFNTPVEVGLRAATLLFAMTPKSADIQRIIYYDYFLLHSSDIEDGPSSIHPTTPHRSCEILVKRELMQKGLILMQSKELIQQEFNSTGIQYRATNLTGYFINYLSSKYAKLLIERAHWVVNRFKEFGDEQLRQYVYQNLDRWGSEFTREALVRGRNDVNEEWILYK